MKHLLALLAFLFATSSWAQEDPRLRTTPFKTGTVYTLRLAPGYVTTVVLNPDERIESVAIGNNSAWEVTPSKSGNHLFIRPLTSNVPTNVEVVTDSRHYSFLLQSTYENDPEALFQFRFDYTDPAELTIPAPQHTSEVKAVVTQTAYYKIKGDKLARPQSVSDDGERTLFTFADKAPLPAIYAIDEHGHETLVTTRKTDGGWIIDRVWPKFILRLGKTTAHVQRKLGEPKR